MAPARLGGHQCSRLNFGRSRSRQCPLQTGWTLSDNESLLSDEHGNRVVILTEDDGYLSIQFDSDRTDASAILERIPFEEAAVVQVVE